jgi:predicted component of type VI protein secretion system
LAKPIQETIFKSRLTITYRTNITGTVTQEPLPFRVLVLGDFTGALPREAELLPELADRPINTIRRGMTVDHFISEIIPTARIPASLTHLRSTLPGKVSGSVKGSVPRSELDKDQSLTLRVKGGSGSFRSAESENGLCDIEGEITIGGQVTVDIASRKVTPNAAKLYVRGVVRGTLTDPRTGKSVGVVSGQLSSQIELAKDKFTVTADEDDAGSSNNRPLIIAFADQDTKAERTIPFPSLTSFGPDQVASSVPELRRLLVIKGLILELQANLRNMPELRKAFKSLLPTLDDTKESAAAKLKPFQELKDWALGEYPLLSVEKQAPKTTDTTQPNTQPPVS